MKFNWLIACKIFCMFFLAFVTACKKDSSSQPVPIAPIPDESASIVPQILLNQENNQIYVNRKWQGIPSVESSIDGRILVTWYSGGGGEGPGNYATVSSSKDHGLTWKKNIIIVAPAKNNYRIFDPGLWKDPHGNLHLFWAQSQSHWDNKGGVWNANITFVNDTIVCSAPKWITDGVMLNKPIVLKNTQQALYPISVWPFQPVSLDKSGAFIYSAEYQRSINDYAAFTKKSRLPLNEKIRTADEHQVAQLKDGRLLAFIRTNQGIYFCYSKDEGKSWSEPEQFKQLGATTSSRFHIQRLGSGNLLLVMNSSNSRDNLTVFLSTDDGKTWPHRLLLDARSNTSYPDACQEKDGMIDIVYDRNRASDKEILLVRIHEKDLLANNNLFKRIIVDK
ncbi:sialidase family protein [Chitinophaga eiseniae]|uniref:Exo-alpha-sialidase n=1 Tax=Chitinophaga eiseniae TaxID=634771 RepID=A0A847S5S0_9BACT|nr:sialidase family protein [Chitinophaga eiseniae]NLR78600.1 exo-alpha-sialidase [Chitinophaga eiseniae]